MIYIKVAEISEGDIKIGIINAPNGQYADELFGESGSKVTTYHFSDREVAAIVDNEKTCITRIL